MKNKNFFYFSLATISFINGFSSDETFSLDSSQKNLAPSVSVFGSYLYWLASEEQMSAYANIQTVETLAEGKRNIFEEKNASFPWSSGFRLGTGYLSEDHLLDFKLYWSWFYTKSHNVIPKGNQVIDPEFFTAFATLDFVYDAQVDWRLKYNVIDLEMGRNFDFDKIFSLKPFIGLKAASIKQNIESFFTGFLLIPANSWENVTNNFNGIGVSGGAESAFYLAGRGLQQFNLNSRLSLAGLYGKYTTDDFYYDSLGRSVPLIVDRIYQGELMFQGLLGFNWLISPEDKKSLFSIGASYEIQWWLNILRFATYQQCKLRGDLTFQGLTLDVKWNF